MEVIDTREPCGAAVEEGDLDGHNDINDTNDMQTGTDGDDSNSSAAHKTAHRTRLRYACICLSAPFHNNHRFITRGMQGEDKVAALSLSGMLTSSLACTFPSALQTRL